MTHEPCDYLPHGGLRSPVSARVAALPLRLSITGCHPWMLGQPTTAKMTRTARTAPAPAAVPACERRMRGIPGWRHRDTRDASTTDGASTHTDTRHTPPGWGPNGIYRTHRASSESAGRNHLRPQARVRSFVLRGAAAVLARVPAAAERRSAIAHSCRVAGGAAAAGAPAGAGAGMTASGARNRVDGPALAAACAAAAAASPSATSTESRCGCDECDR